MSNKYQNNCLQRTVLQRRGGTDKIMSEAMNSVFSQICQHQWLDGRFAFSFALQVMSWAHLILRKADRASPFYSEGVWKNSALGCSDGRQENAGVLNGRKAGCRILHRSGSQIRKSGLNPAHHRGQTASGALSNFPTAPALLLLWEG